MRRLALIWILNALALMAVAYLMPSITVQSFGAAMGAALLLGTVNTLIRPVLALLTLPISLLTLGFFYLLLNGLLFWMAGSVFSGFAVGGFWSGVWGGLLYGLIAWALSLLLLPEQKSE